IKLACPWPAVAVCRKQKLPSELGGTDFVVLAPGANSPYRIWPSRHFAKVANRIASSTSFRIVLTGTPSERSQTAAVAAACGPKPIDLTGKLDLEALIRVLAESKLILTNETGTAHLGAALRVPTICVVGGGHFARYVPYPSEAQD